jgi:signal transduction histidine kinase
MRLRTDIEPGLPSVRMDENAMTLVVLNLIDNAVKYAAEGKEIAVSLARTPGGVVLSVRDRGPGIPIDEQPRVFERFYRARMARDRNVRGSGIGLALVKHIVEAHGGRLALASAPGQGARFTVVIPAAPVVAAVGAVGSGPTFPAGASAAANVNVNVNPTVDPAAALRPVKP